MCVCPLPYVCLLPIRRFVTTQIFSVYSSCHFTVVTTNTRPQALRFFLRVQTLRFGGRQSTATMVFYALAQSRFFPCFKSTRKNMSAFKPFFNILLPDLAPLHVKITKSTNLLSVCRRKLKLPTYLHTVSYKHISFLNARSQFVRVLASSGFYSIT